MPKKQSKEQTKEQLLARMYLSQYEISLFFYKNPKSIKQMVKPLILKTFFHDFDGKYDDFSY